MTRIRATYIESFVWCADCGEPHEADVDNRVLIVSDPCVDACSAIAPDVVGADPDDWNQSTHHATLSHDDSRYDLWLKRPPLDPDIHMLIVPRRLS